MSNKDKLYIKFKDAGFNPEKWDRPEIKVTRLESILTLLKMGDNLEHFIDDGFTLAQISEIAYAKVNNWDISDIVNPNMSYRKMNRLYSLRSKGIIPESKLKEFTNPMYTPSDLYNIILGKEVKYTDEQLLNAKDFKFDSDQVAEISKGIELGLDALKYANIDYTPMQMRELRRHLELGLPIEKYANPGVSVEGLRKLRSKHLKHPITNDNLNEYLTEVEINMNGHNCTCNFGPDSKKKSNKMEIV